MRALPRLSLKQFAARGLLALAFLFAQQTAALHWLSHAIEATQDQAASGNAAAPHHCDECITVAALGAAAAAAGFVFPLSAARFAPAAPPGVAAAPAVPRLAFRSRAPPTLS